MGDAADARGRYMFMPCFQGGTASSGEHSVKRSTVSTMRHQYLGKEYFTYISLRYFPLTAKKRSMRARLP